MKTRIWSAVVIGMAVVGGAWGAQKSSYSADDAPAQVVTDSSNPATQAFNVVQQFRDEVARLKRSGASGVEAQAAYERMIQQLGVPNQFAHLAFPAEDANRAWTVNAKRVAKGIKPKINYQVVNGETAICFQGTPAVQQNLQDNVRLIAWYREQMEKSCPNEQTAKGTYALARLIDAYLEKFADSVPPVEVRMAGKINEPHDQRIEYSHREVWEMLAAINRYFFYKIQLHDEKVRDFYPADLLLMGSLIRTAAIYGASPPVEALGKIETRLHDAAKDWRADAFVALRSWKDEQRRGQNEPQQLCTITIPVPQPPPAPAAVPTETAFPPDVEDVKELGGKIFLKRNGRWTLWEPGK